jgi:hypothetical protein
MVGCSAYSKLQKEANDAFINRDYDQAVDKATNALRLNPAYEKSQKLLPDAYRLFVETHEKKIVELNASNAKFKWDGLVAEYSTLIRLTDGVKSLPTMTNEKTKQTIVIPVKDYSAQLTEAKTNASESHYQEVCCQPDNGRFLL